MTRPLNSPRGASQLQRASQPQNRTKRNSRNHNSRRLLMKGLLVPLFAVVLAAAILEVGNASSSPVLQSTGGTIKGHVHLGGKLPGNSVIRMGKDPKCSEMNKGKQVVQETVKATIDGSLADVFVRLEGAFPSTPVPKTPVTIDPRSCVYSPRVVGVRVGQALEIRND